METTSIAQEIAALPPEAQRQVVDFGFSENALPNLVSDQKNQAHSISG